ncbi:MAG: succinylglutamate desuccinylase/aspartoacylase family protein [Candidatus Woesearchaeota archaeon]
MYPYPNTNRSVALERGNISLFKAAMPGKKVCILGGVHGNEIAGINAVMMLMAEGLNIDEGEVCLIICNQKAIDTGRRFVDENLNRCFLKGKEKTVSYEENIAEELKQILKNFDICIDIHNSNTPGSEPFIICEENADALLDSIPAEKVVYGFDRLEPGGTDYHMNRTGKIGICIECGYAEDRLSIEFARKTILNLLKKTGNIKAKSETFNKKDVFRLEKTYIPKDDFRIVKRFADFEPLAEEELIGFDGEKRIIAGNACNILFPRDIIKSQDSDGEAFLLIQKLYK